jgi:hypothetical protein
MKPAIKIKECKGLTQLNMIHMIHDHTLTHIHTQLHTHTHEHTHTQSDVRINIMQVYRTSEKMKPASNLIYVLKFSQSDFLKVKQGFKFS